MAEFSPTAAQLEAMTLTGPSLLVAAGAGSGKTKVLTERVLHAVCDPSSGADIDSFLVISYTRAAAAELRGRIMEALAERLAADPSNRRLLRQSALLSRAQISTIHSFCAQLLRENCQLAHLSPDFKVLDEDRAAAMRASVLERVLEQAYDGIDEDAGFRLLADTIGEGRDDRSLAELVLRLQERMQSHAWPEDWAAGQIALLDRPYLDAGETPWGHELLQWAKGLADFHAAELEALIGEMDAFDAIREKFAPDFSELAAVLRELSRRLSVGWDAALAVLPYKAARQPVLRKVPDVALYERLKNRRKAAVESLDKIAKLINAPSESVLRDLAATAPAMRALLHLTLRFDREYLGEKRKRSLADYADLEHMTAKLLLTHELAPTELARRLSERWREVMVDEYQDVSPVQDAIFRAVSDGGRKLFLVGDVKQSIYRFRLADPTIFTRKYDAYAKADPALCRRVLLRENFRSRAEILDAANAVFSLCMSPTLGDVDYNADAALIRGADYYAGCVPKPELLLLPTADAPDKTAAEAAYVASRIRELVASGATVTTREGVRPLACGDIAILLRSPNAVGGIYRRALLDLGIPVGKAQGSGYYESPEITAVTSMLTIMDNPHKDIPLIAVLRSAPFGFTPDELSAVRAADRDSDLFTALEAASESMEKARSFLDRLAKLRGACADLSAAETVWSVLESLDMLALCSAMDDGRRRRENLLALVELAESFEKTGYRGLHRFVLWLASLAGRGQEPSPGGDASAVQILSIHKSKGLEFPVVFLCDAARGFNARDRQETVLVHPELGLGPKLVDTVRRVSYPTLARAAIAKRIEREDLSEEMRLLYVAMTRARERLFITAAFSDPDKEIEKLRPTALPPLSPETLMRAGSFASWLITACLADENAHLRMSVVDPAREQAQAESESPAVPADPAAALELRRRLAFCYGHSAAQELPSKITATELKGREEADEDAAALVKPASFSFRMPELDRAERPLRAVERGVATHLLLQYMDFQKGRSRAGIRAEIERLRAARFLSAREADAVNVSAVERLFSSELGARMLAAKEPLREFRFSLLLDASRLYPEAEGEELLLQGVVDCCLVEDDGLVIIDYKTDRVKTEAEITARAAHYRGQLLAYSEALGRILQRPVKRCVLFFLVPGETVDVDTAE